MRAATIAGSISPFSIRALAKAWSFLPAGYQLGDNAVVRVECVAASRLRASRFDQQQPIAPSLGQRRGRNADPLGVVAVHLVERRQLTDRSVDAIGLAVVWVVEEGDVDLHGGGRLPREAILRDGRQYRLTADHDNIGVIGDLACGAKDVLELLALHAACSQPLRVKASRTCWR